MYTNIIAEIPYVVRVLWIIIIIIILNIIYIYIWVYIRDSRDPTARHEEHSVFEHRQSYDAHGRRHGQRRDVFQRFSHESCEHENDLCTYIFLRRRRRARSTVLGNHRTSPRRLFNYCLPTGPTSARDNRRLVNPDLAARTRYGRYVCQRRSNAVKI